MNKTKLTIKDSAFTFLASFLLCQIGVVVATCVTMIVYKLTKADMTIFFGYMNTSVGYLISALSLYFVMLLIFFFFNKGKENKITGKINPTKLIMYIGIAIASFISLYPIITCVDTLLFKIGVKISNLPYPLTTSNYFLSLISLVVAPAVCEELLFRGIIFKGLKKHGKIFSIIISASMFCIFHMSISQSVYPILMGLLLGVIMFYENNIYYCIAVHLTNNFLSLTLSYFKINLIFNHWSYILLAIILVVVFISCVLYFIIRKNKFEEKTPLTTKEKIYLSASFAIMILLWIIINFS